MKTIELEISGMTCDGCARTIEGAIRSVEGVEQMKVRHPQGRGTLELADGATVGGVIKAVEEAGYGAKVVDDGRAPSRESNRVTGGRSTDSGFHYDLIVIGTGGAGMAAAIRGAELGGSVGIVESGTEGGTCVNVGCIPSKNLIAAAEHVHLGRRGFPGVAPTEPIVDWSALIGQKRQVVDHLREKKYLDVLAAYPEIRLIKGRASLTREGAVEVNGLALRARGVVIATGTSPWAPPVPGLDRVDYLTSTSAMELEERPESLVILGASAVGLELGQAFARFGTSVTVLELLPRILPTEDPELAILLRRYLEDEGIEIHTGARPLRIERRNGRIAVTAEHEGETLRVQGERIFVATGRRANTADIGLEVLGVETDDQGFIRVDEAMRTSRPGVYAAGDVTGGPGFVYVAAAGGRLAAENALQGTAQPLDLSVVPRVTFTSPQLGAVGLTEDEARERGFSVQVGRLPLEHLPRAAVTHDPRGLVKMVAEEGTGKLLGLHALGAAAGELLGEGALALRLGASVQEIVETLHPYLTWTEAVKLAAQMVDGDVAKLSCCA
ncbi:MAG: mercury(II) reductase [Gemmatimonadota bacterium]